MPQALGTSFSGVSRIDTLTAEQRIFGRTSEILRITRGRKTLMRIVQDKQNTLPPVNDVVFKYKSDIDRPVLIDVAAASTTVPEGTHAKIWLLDKHAKFVEVGRQILNRDHYYNGTTFTTTLAAGNTQIEMLLVLQKGASDGTKTWFIVKRGFKPAAGGTSGTPQEITTAHKLVLLQKSQADGNVEGSMYGDTPNEEFNHCETNLYKFGATTTSEKIKIYQTETPMERNGRRQMNAFWNDEEMACIFGRRDIEVNADGETILRKGGIDEYIETSNSKLEYVASEHLVDFSALGPLNAQTLNEFGKDKFYFGSDTKWWVLPDSHYTSIANAYDNKIRLMVNAEMSRGLSARYGFKITALDISNGGTFLLTPSDAFSLRGINKFNYIIDFDHFKKTPFMDEDFQVLINVESGMNIRRKVNYILMNSSYWRTNPHAFWKIFNFI